MKKLMHDTFKADYSKYQFFEIPMSGFGVGTMYPKAAAGDKIDIKTEGLFGDPRTWWINPADSDANGKAADEIFSSADSATVELKGNKTKSISLSAALPALFKLLTAKGGIEWSKTLQVSLTADSATNHLINWPALDDAVNGVPDQKPPAPKLIKDSVARHIHQHDFVITVGDVVLTNFKAHVSIVGKLDANGQGQLDQAVATFSKDSKVSFDYKSNGDGSFDLIAKKPVVVAVYIGIPPAGSLRAAGNVQVDVLKTPNLIKQLQNAEVDGVTIPED
jgi:hypothetical protein